MPNEPSLTAAEIDQLRRSSYNARVVETIDLHPDLRIIRAEPDAGVPAFKAGQYLPIGLGNWEPRVAGVQEEHLNALHLHRLSKRAYSLSCSLVDARGRLVRAQDCSYIELYLTLVRHAARHAPALSPRLFRLAKGDRLFVESHASGNYVLDAVQPEDNLLFLATGTGEAPHNAMIAELLARGHRGRIACATCVRYRHDLAYLPAHREVERQCANYRYVPLTTREPENTIATAPGYVGKRYLQDFVRSGEFQQYTGFILDPHTTRVFLCGQPDMIGLPNKQSAVDSEPPPPPPAGMIALLMQRGFVPDEPHRAGNIHFERFW